MSEAVVVGVVVTLVVVAEVEAVVAVAATVCGGWLSFSEASKSSNAVECSSQLSMVRLLAPTPVRARRVNGTNKGV